MSRIRVNPSLSLDADELRFTFVASGGPGGQHVNKTATRAVLTFDVLGSPSLSPWQRYRVCAALAGRISRDGLLRIACSRHRSQDGNRREATAMLCRLLAAALKPRRARRATRPTAASVERRLREKSVRRTRKNLRRRPASDE
jgi:ribosome-associated protein